MSTHEDVLRSLRDELLAENNQDDSPVTRDEEDLVAGALRRLQPGDLHPVTIDLALDQADTRDLPTGHAERSQARVKKAVAEMRRRTQPPTAEMLHEARRHVGLTETAAAEDLGITRGLLKRIEAGGVALLLNQAPERVAEYVSHLHLDPRAVLSTLFAELRPSPGHPQGIYGYTPGLELAERERALREAADSAEQPYEIEWAVAFLLHAENYQRR